jgi:hypothetical protein
MCKVFFLCLVFFSSFTLANQPFSFFVKHEFNATDSITGFGATALIGSQNSLLKGELVSSLNYAEVFDEKGIMRDFLSLDTGVRLGFYGKAFIYIEAGFDTFEMFMDEERDENNFNDSRENNGVDGYAGLGTGINAKHVRIEAFVKARQIDGDTWDSDKQVFYGLQLSLFF